MPWLVTCVAARLPGRPAMHMHTLATGHGHSMPNMSFNRTPAYASSLCRSSVGGRRLT
jgi:hypothetical protein